MREVSKKNIVTKSNTLIQTRYTLSVQEQRIVLLLVSLIQPEDVDITYYKIPIKEFKDIVGIKGESSYNELKKITEKLRQRTFSIERDNDGLLQTGWVSSVEYVGGESYIELMIDPKLKPYLLNLKQYFTSYKLQNIIRLKSAYSIRIYELLKQYEKIRERTFLVDELKVLLGVEDKYSQYYDFKRKCILKAQKELEEKTDISFTFSERKKSRKVVEIIFHIKTKMIEQITNNSEIKISNINNELYTTLTEYFCLSPNQAQEILDTYPIEHINDTLEYIEKKYKNNEIDNIGAYTVKAFKENARFQKSLFDKEMEEEKSKADEIRRNSLLQEAKEMEYKKLDREYRQYIQKEVEVFIESLPEANKRRLEETATVKVKKIYNGHPSMIPNLVKLEIDKIVQEQVLLISKEEFLERNIRAYPALRNKQ